MIVQFKWNLVSIPHAAMTIISKMVKFRDVYSFRAAIRHHYDSQTSALYFLTIDFNKKVTYSTRTGRMAAMNREEEKNGDVNGSLGRHYLISRMMIVATFSTFISPVSQRIIAFKKKTVDSTNN